MKIGWMRGHQTPYNGGAVGIKSEEDLINEVSDIVFELFHELGVEIVDCTPKEREYYKIGNLSDSLSLRCKKANDEEADMVISLHFNYFNGNAHGVEVFYTSENGKKIASPIQDEMVKLGYTDRGVKHHKGLYVLNNTNAPAVLIEGGFCDSKRDMELYNPRKLAEAIVKGITGESVNRKPDINALKDYVDSLGYDLVER